MRAAKRHFNLAMFLPCKKFPVARQLPLHGMDKARSDTSHPGLST